MDFIHSEHISPYTDKLYTKINHVKRRLWCSTY